MHSSADAEADQLHHFAIKYRLRSQGYSQTSTNISKQHCSTGAVMVPAASVEALELGEAGVFAPVIHAVS